MTAPALDPCASAGPGCRVVACPDAVMPRLWDAVEMIERLSDSSRDGRALVRCRSCGQSYGWSFHETHWAFGPEDMLVMVVQVADREDLDGLTMIDGPSPAGRLHAGTLASGGGAQELSWSGRHAGTTHLAWSR
jgi:hypothetical protein